jgi:hypothetical protein
VSIFININGNFQKCCQKSNIHERAITLRFLGITLKVLRLEVSAWIILTIGKEVWFSIRFSSFLIYRNFKRLHVFEEIEISGKAVAVTVNNRVENSYDFCLDLVREFGLRKVEKLCRHRCKEPYFARHFNHVLIVIAVTPKGGGGA